nr:hypothetical protein [Tanacetum cinerariifolium]
MATILEQQVALDEALVPSTQSTQIKTLTDVNVNKLYQPWRSFAAVINKCLTAKVLALTVSGYLKHKFYGDCITEATLSATAKGKQHARATTPTEPTDVERTEAEQLKIILRTSRQETHISQQHGSGTDEGTGSKPGVPDVPSDDSEEELSWNSFDDEDVDEQTKGKDKSEGEKTDESDDDDDDHDEAKKYTLHVTLDKSSFGSFQLPAEDLPHATE